MRITPGGAVVCAIAATGAWLAAGHPASATVPGWLDSCSTQAVNLRTIDVTINGHLEHVLTMAPDSATGKRHVVTVAILRPGCFQRAEVTHTIPAPKP